MRGRRTGKGGEWVMKLLRVETPLPQVDRELSHDEAILLVLVEVVPGLETSENDGLFFTE